LKDEYVQIIKLYPTGNLDSERIFLLKHIFNSSTII